MGLLDRLGVGSADVDTRLDTERVRPGDEIPARIEVTGGNDEQTIDEIELELQVQYRDPQEEGGYEYATKTIFERELGGFTIAPGDEWVREVDPIPVPVYTPSTVDEVRVWIETTLEIDWAKDPTDRDEIDVEPGPYLAAMMDAVESMGFQLEKSFNGWPAEFGRFDEYAQYFEYEDYGGTPFRGLDDLEIKVDPYEGGLYVGMTVESRTPGGESRYEWTEFRVETTDREAVTDQFRRQIEMNR